MYNGEITFKSRHKQLAFAYVPQCDELSAFLTVRETLLLASKLKNPPGTDHKHTVRKLMEDFSLVRCADHLASKCSGGERKRLSIGCEMISQPDVLILDEPTSGLDSTTSLKVMQTLKQNNSGTAIITTIHQPNSKLFQIFDQVYFLTSGQCIYFGSPSAMVSHLTTLQIEVPTYMNPADFMLDVANDDRSAKGSQLISRLAQSYTPTRRESGTVIDESTVGALNTLDSGGKSAPQLCSNCCERYVNGNGNGTSVRNALTNAASNNCLWKTVGFGFGSKCGKAIDHDLDTRPPNYDELRLVSRSKMQQAAPFYRTYPLLMWKLFLCTIRDPQQSVFRLLNNMLLPLILHVLTTGEHGRESGCSFVYDNSTHVRFENTYERFDRQEIGTQNAGLTFLDLMFAFFSTLVPAILAISGHINVLRKEHMNSYYSINSFYAALLTMCSLSTLLFATVNAFAYFWFTGQTFTPYKLFFFWTIIVATSLLGDMLGLALSIMFPRKSLTALVIGGFFGFGLHTFSGFFVPTDKMAGWFSSITWYVFCRHTFEGIVKTFYGHGQCAVNESMVFTFDMLLDFVDYYNHETKEGLQIVQKMPLKVRTALEQKPWNKSAIFELAEAVNDLDQDGLDRLDYFWQYKTSYIMDNYDVPHSPVEENLMVPFITWIGLIVFCLLLLRHKLKK